MDGITYEVSDEDLELFVIATYGVIRPLCIPSSDTKYGEVLSHSAILASTVDGDFIIEYMHDNKVYVRRCFSHDASMPEFHSNGFNFKHDFATPQKPNSLVTVGEMAETMRNHMKNGVFNTFYHNCHIAKRLTLESYGVSTKSLHRNPFFQGFVDFFSS